MYKRVVFLVFLSFVLAVKLVTAQSIGGSTGLGGVGEGGGPGGASIGAIGNGTNDDLVPIQKAIWANSTTNGAPFGTCAGGAHSSVYLSPPRVCYAHSAPIRLTCGAPEFYAGGGGGLCNLDYIGPAVIQESSGTPGALPYDPPLVPGPPNSHSLRSTSGQLSKFIDLGRFLYARKVGTGIGDGLLNGGAINTAMNLSFFMRPTAIATPGQVFCSNPAYPGSGSGSVCFTQDFGGSGAVAASITVLTDGAHTFAACPGQINNSNYELELDWDGTTYRVWQGALGGAAVLCDSWASSHYIIAGKYEEMLLPSGGPTQFWPAESSNNNNAFIGDIGPIRIESASRGNGSTSYTVPVVAPPIDGSTLYVDYFETSLDGTQIGHTTSGGAAAVYSVILGGGAVIGRVAGSYIHDIDFCSLANGPGSFSNQVTEGFYSSGANGSRWSNLTCSNVDYLGAEFIEGYYAHLDNWNSFGGKTGLSFGAAWNYSQNTGAGVDGTSVACEAYAGGGGAQHYDGNTRCVDRGGPSGPEWGSIENQSSGTYEHFTPDQGASSPNWKGSHLLNAPALPYVFTSGVMVPGDTGVYVQQDNGGVGPTFIGTDFATHGAPPEMINFTNGTPTSPAQLINVSLPSGVPTSNLPRSVRSVENVATPSGRTYYIAPLAGGGSDSNSGAAGHPWLTPNHALTCGDQVLAVPGTYDEANFRPNNWGVVTCPANNDVAWLKCSIFDTCKINLSVAGHDAMTPTQSYWGVQGWEVHASTVSTNGCFEAYPPDSNHTIHHIIFANDIANGCGDGAFITGQSASHVGVDYLAIIGDIAYNAAQDNANCYSGIDVVVPVNYDSLPGTHIYVGGNFSWGNVDPSPCSGAAPTDGEGINFDTVQENDYSGQIVVANNISVYNGGPGIQAYLNQTSTPPAPIYVYNNTTYGNETGVDNLFPCSEIVANGSLSTKIYNNIAMTTTATACNNGSGPVAYTALATGGILDTTTQIFGNFAYSAAGNNTFNGGGTFTFGTNLFGTSPSFVNPVEPSAPNCGAFSNVPACMATMIANFKPMTLNTSGYGYQPLPINTHDPLFPKWLSSVTNMPPGLIAAGE